MQHVEFFNIDHFNNDYHRVKPGEPLGEFIDFFWETKFETLWENYPDGFSDALFPNIGYTYLFNLGTPFVMQVGEKKFDMKTDGFLPRHTAIECYHRPGNHLFGIKFKISPVIFERKINFGEYREFIYPLSYLIEPSVITSIKTAASFQERVKILNDYFSGLVEKYSGSWDVIRIVTSILSHCEKENDFITPVEEYANQYNISSRTLHRYFEAATSLSSKKAIQVLRIRSAVQKMVSSPETFSYKDFGYYDYSHFCKHLKQFLHKDTLVNLKPHLKLLSAIR